MASDPPWRTSLNLPVFSQGEWAAARFYGDAQRATAYLPVASALLGEVKHRMSMGGVSYGHRKIQLPDGTIIRVIRNHEQNILSIDTSETTSSRLLTPLNVFGYLCYPKGGGLLVKGWVPPWLKGDPPPSPYGTLAEDPMMLDDPGSGYVTNISTNYGEKELRLTVSRMTKSQAGNQFSFDGLNVYSWWGSPTGDGPLFEVDDPLMGLPPWMYRPYLLGATLCYNVPFWKSPMPPVCPKTVYRNGGGVFTAPDFVGCFRIVQITDTLRTGLLITTGGTAYEVKNDRLSETSAQLVSASDIRHEAAEMISWCWPWRISQDGSQAATIVKIMIPVGAFQLPKLKAVCLIKAALSYSEKDGFASAGVSVQRTEFMEAYTGTVTLERKNTPMVNETVADVDEVLLDGNPTGFKSSRVTVVIAREGTYTVVWSSKTELAMTVPFALCYDHNELRVTELGYGSSQSLAQHRLTEVFRSYHDTRANTYAAEWIPDPIPGNPSRETRKFTLTYGESMSNKEGFTVADTHESGKSESLSFSTKNKNYSFSYNTTLSGAFNKSDIIDSHASASAKAWGYYDGWHQGGPSGGVESFTYDLGDIKKLNSISKSEGFSEQVRGLGILKIDILNDVFMSIHAPSQDSGGAEYSSNRDSYDPGDGSRSFVWPCIGHNESGCNAYLTGYGIIMHEPPPVAVANTQSTAEGTRSKDFDFKLDIYGEQDQAHHAQIYEQSYPYAYHVYADDYRDGDFHEDSYHSDENSMENYAPDIINQLVDIRFGLSCSVTLDTRPRLLEQRPSYMTSVSINIGGDAEHYLKRTTSLNHGDPNEFLKYDVDHFTINPIGLF